MQCLLGAVRSAGVTPCHVVLGYRAAFIRDLLSVEVDSMIVNEHYEEGQLSSLQCGLRVLPEDQFDAALVMPVDHPLISSELIRRIIARFRQGYPSAVIPTFSGKRGHPTLFSKHLFQELLQCPKELGARAVLRNHSKDLAFLSCNEEAVVLDIDTPDDYRRVLQSRLLWGGVSAKRHHPPNQHEPLTKAARYCARCGGRLEMKPVEPEGKPQRVCTLCQYVMYLNPKVVACTLPVRDGKLLLIRRNIEPSKGLWTFPGGFVDLGESVWEAAQRETREEVGIDVCEEELLGVYSYPQSPHVIVVYVVLPEAVPFVPGPEVQEACFFEPQGIPWDELAFASTREAIEDWLTRTGHPDRPSLG